MNEVGTAARVEQAPSSQADLEGRPRASAPTGFTRFFERLADGDQDIVVSDLLAKIALRKQIVALCVLVPFLLALGVTFITPMTWQASTKILIRYSPSESVFLKGLIPDDRVTLSGAASSEIIRSLPTLEEVVKRYDIQDSDLYQPTSRVISGYLIDIFRKFVPVKDDDTPEFKLTDTARRFQDSLRASSALSGSASKAAPIEVLGSNTPIPQSFKGDEIITLTVKAFNRAKVAELTNGLAAAFIDQYYKISAEDAQRSIDFLSQLEQSLSTEVEELQRAQGDASAPSANAGGDASVVRNSPLITALASDLANRQAELVRSKQLYVEGSAEITRQQAAIDSLNALISGQERVEVAKQVLERIRERRFQALNTERLYQDHLVPISIFDPALTPPASKSAIVVRFATAGVTGLLVGAVFGLSVALVLSLLDPRIRSSHDVEKALKIPVAGWTPRFGELHRTEGELPILDESAIHAADNSLSQLIGNLLKKGNKLAPPTIALASASDDDGKSFVSLLLAKAIARDSEARVLLIDADSGRAGLTKLLSRRWTSASSTQGLAKLIVSTDDAGIDLAPQRQGRDQSASRYSQWLWSVIESARGVYDLVIVDTPSSARGGRTIICCESAECVLIVVKCGETRKAATRSFVQILRDASIEPLGAILNGWDRRA